MKFRLTILSILYIPLLTAQNITFNKIPLLDQLPVSAIHRIYQDSEGYMWYGTVDGLCRDDGYSIQTFRSGLETPDLFADNQISCIVEDKENKLWVGTIKGLYILDKSNYRIYPFEMSKFAGMDVRLIYCTRDGSVWISAPGTVFQYRADGVLINEFPIVADGRNELINCFHEDRDANLWMTTWNGHIFCMDRRHEKIQLRPSSVKPVSFIVQDRYKPYFWMGTWDEGVVRYEPDAPEDSMFTFQPLARNHFDRPDPSCLYGKQDDVYGYIWVTGLTDLYAYRVNERDMLEQVDLYTSLPRVNKMLNDIIEDHRNNLWVTSFDKESFIVGLNDRSIRSYPIVPLKKQTGNDPAIMAICEDDDGMFWLLQERRGLYVYNSRTEEISHYTDSPQTRGLDLGSIVYIEKSKQKGKVWIAPLSNRVVYCMSQQRLNMRLEKEIRLNDRFGDTGNVRTLFEDTAGNLWIGTTNELYVYFPKDNTVRRVDTVKGQINAMTQTTDRAVWICTEEGELYKAMNATDVERFKLKKDLTAIDATSDGKLWLGTKQGNVLSFDPVANELKDYSTDSGMNGNTIYKIVVDMHNHVWICGNQKITGFNPQNSAYRNYLTSDEELCLKRFLPRSVYENSNGIIYYAGIPGFIAITPSHNLESIPRNVKVHITNISVAGKSLLFDQSNPLTMLDYLELPPKTQNLEIRFSSLDHRNANKIRYAYQLKGVDPDWVYIDNGRNSAFYNQLQKGRYTFRVKATDENGLWSNNVKEFIVYRRPAFYETWWAYMLYVLLFATLVYVILTLYLQHMKDLNDKKFTEKVTQMKLRYFTNISHELLTPLSVISFITGDLETTGDQNKATIRMLSTNVQRLKHLLQQVLDFRKVEMGNMALSVSADEVVSFIDRIYRNGFALIAEKRRINVDFRTEYEQIGGYFDRDKLDKIMHNLLSNAFKYTAEGKSVWISVRKEMTDGHEYAVISVGDEGVGIAPKELSRIFVRFYNNRSSVETGSSNGIGLSLTKDLVELHHGNIRVESRPGKGSVFTIRIPVDKESYADEEFSEEAAACRMPAEQEHQAAEEDTPDSYAGQKQTRILLVEDNQDLLTLIKNKLRGIYETYTAENGLEAFDVLQKQDIDIVVSDVMMPGMNGWELCRKIRSEITTSHVIVVLLTAKTQPEDQIDSYEAGADAYMAKPFDLRVLEARLGNLLRNRRKQQQQFQRNPELNTSEMEITSLDERFIQKIVGIVEEHIAEENFDIALFAELTNMSRSTLTRKLKQLTGLKPLEFIRNIKMKHACRMLSNKSISISEVAFALGYSDRKYFTNCFKEDFGVTPSEYRNGG